MELHQQSFPFDLLPNEALLEVFKQLDAVSLTKIMRVNHQWDALANSSALWRRLCKSTNRIIGKHTKQWCKDFSMLRTWKNCYFIINSKDLGTFKDIEQICEHANEYENDSRKRKYMLCRGLDLFPDSPLMLQQMADYFSERQDVNGSWEIAERYYKRAIELSETEQKKDKDRKELDKNRKTMLWSIYRYAVYLYSNKNDINESHNYFKLLIKLLPSNPWVLEKYAEFTYEYRYKYNLSERIYRLILNMTTTSSSLISYGMFLWQVRRNIIMAGKCLRIASELDVNKIYVYVNFLGREMKDEEMAKEILMRSKLYKQVMIDSNNDINDDDDNNNNISNNISEIDDQKIFSLALSYHQIHNIDDAEYLYRKHLSINNNKLNICTLSNLAELLLHSKLDFNEAERLYRIGLEMNDGSNDTIQVALGSLMLARGQLNEGLDYMYKLVQLSNIKSSRNSYTEAWMIIYFHTASIEALKNVKYQLYTLSIRPKLILMFDANLLWARNHFPPYIYEWMVKLSSVYNCEEYIEILDEWDDWVNIDVDDPIIDDDESELSFILSSDHFQFDE